VLELEEFAATGKSLISLKEGIDLSTAAGRLMAHILSAMASFERDRIRERILLGLARVKAQGKRLGRPRKTLCRPHANLNGKTRASKTDVFPEYHSAVYSLDSIAQT
jgi:DNA invertase Pin-like site-specific DNA recombinase